MLVEQCVLKLLGNDQGLCLLEHVRLLERIRYLNRIFLLDFDWAAYPSTQCLPMTRAFDKTQDSIIRVFL